MLALFVFCLVIVDLIILVTYTISQGVLNNLASERVVNKENPEDRVGVSQCKNDYQNIDHRYFIVK